MSFFGFNSLVKEKKKEKKAEDAQRKALAKKIKKIKELSKAEQELLLRLHIIDNDLIATSDLTHEFKRQLDGLVTKGYVQVETTNHSKRYHLSTKPEFINVGMKVRVVKVLHMGRFEAGDVVEVVSVTKTGGLDRYGAISPHCNELYYLYQDEVEKV